MVRYVAYYRVSRESQRRSGLGLAAQRSVIEKFVGADDELIGEFVEAQSGRRNDREELTKALLLARKRGAKLLIAKLDRFSRRVSFIASIMEQGVGLVVAEMPNATDFQLHIHAALAQEERRMISERTRLALAEAKKRGVILGKNGRKLAQANRAAACDRANRLSHIILPLREEGVSLGGIADHLNAAGLKPARGGRYHPEQVRLIIRRLAEAQ